MASVQSIVIIYCLLLLGALCDSAPGKGQKRAVGVLTAKMKTAIVAQHNKYRANERASDMKLMRWDDGVAATAQKWVNKCRFMEHSKNPGLGENIYASSGRNFENTVAKFTPAWWGEKSEYKYKTRKCASGKQCGHYTQVVWAGSYKVGCGIKDCLRPNGKIWTVVVCNYSPPGNYKGRAPFNNIGGPCTHCKVGDYCYKGLCANVARDGKKFRAKRQKRAVGVLTEQMKTAIVAQHNKYRADERASDMKLMTWDDGVAATAQNWVNKCRFMRHSQNPGLGENIYASSGRKFEDDVAQFTPAWWGEKSDYNYNTLKCASGKQCGHYTQVVWAGSYKVGCGIQDCPGPNGQTWTTVVCNYSPAGNYNGRAPFNNIGGPCANCEVGDYCHEGLCANVARDGKKFGVLSPHGGVEADAEAEGMSSAFGEDTEWTDTEG